MQRFDSGMQRQVHRQLVSWAADVKALARKLVPIRTGYLQSTIYAKIIYFFSYIFSFSTYALFIELGTKYMQAQPYLYPAIHEYLPQLESIIVSDIEQAKVEAGLP